MCLYIFLNWLIFGLCLSSSLRLFHSLTPEIDIQKLFKYPNKIKSLEASSTTAAQWHVFMHLNRSGLWFVFSLQGSTTVAYISHNSRRGNSSWISAPTSQHRSDSSSSSSSSVRSVRVWAGQSSRSQPHGEVFVPAEMSLSSTQSSDASSRRRRPAEHTQGERLQLVFSLW